MLNECGKKLFSCREEIKEIFKKFKVEILIFSIYFLYLIILRMIIPIFNETNKYFNLPADWTYYIMMAKDICSIFRGEIKSPFCFRPLMPFLAGILPFDLQTNFAILSFISIYLTGIMLYFTLKLHFNKILSLIGLIMYCYLGYLGEHPYWDCFYPSYFFNVYLVDPLAHFFIVCCCYLILSRKKRLYSFFLFLGTLTKEVTLFTIPVFLIYLIFEENKILAKKDFFRKLLKNIVYIIPSCFIFLFLLLLIKTQEVFAYSDLITYDLIKYRYIEFWRGEDLIFYTFGIWGILIFFFFFNEFKDIIRWIKHYGIFIILIYFQIFIALSNLRLIYAGFFPMIYLAVSGLNRIIYIIQKKYNTS